jgi:hypothetical protein
MTESWWAGTVLMAVPLEHAPEVARLLTDIKAGKLPTNSSATDEMSVTVQGQGEWREQMVRSLADQLSYPGVAALFDHCAAAPGDWVNKATVEEAEGISPYQLRNELGALSKLTRRLFGEVIWPLEWKKDHGKYHYRMDPQVAQWWTEIRGAQR